MSEQQNSTRKDELGHRETKAGFGDRHCGGDKEHKRAPHRKEKPAKKSK